MTPHMHPQRTALHNEIHARPPESMAAPLAISHIVMLADAAGRAASREHLAALLRDHHLPLPDEGSTHLRMDIGGAFRVRWELHTEFVTWTFSRPIAPEYGGFDLILFDIYELSPDALRKKHPVFRRRRFLAGNRFHKFRR